MSGGTVQLLKWLDKTERPHPKPLSSNEERGFKTKTLNTFEFNNRASLSLRRRGTESEVS